jgi:hypothetical protein
MGCRNVFGPDKPSAKRERIKMRPRSLSEPLIPVGGQSRAALMDEAATILGSYTVRRTQSATMLLDESRFRKTCRLRLLDSENHALQLKLLHV